MSAVTKQLCRLWHFGAQEARSVEVTNIEYPFPDGALIVSRTDTSGIITHANQAFVDISGWSREELIGAPHSLLRHPDMPRQAFAQMWATLHQGQPWQGHVKNRRRDGGFYWVLATVIPNIRHGRLIGYSSIRRKPCRADVEAAEQVYAALLAEEQAPEREHA